MSTLSQFFNPSIGTTNVGNFRLFDSSGTVTVPSSAVYIAYAALGGGSTAYSFASETLVTPFPAQSYSQTRIVASGSGGGFSYNDGTITMPAPVTATVTIGASGNSTGGAAGNTSITGIPLGSIFGNGGSPGNTGGGTSSGGIINTSGGPGKGFTVNTGPAGPPGAPAYANVFVFSGGGAGGLYSDGGSGTGLEFPNASPLTLNNVGGGGAGGSGGGTGGNFGVSGTGRPGMSGLAGIGGVGSAGTTTISNINGTPGYIIQYNSRGNFSQVKTFFAAAGGGGGGNLSGPGYPAAGHGGAGGGGGSMTATGGPAVTSYGTSGDGGFMGGGGAGAGYVGGGPTTGGPTNVGNNYNSSYFSGNGGRGGGGGSTFMSLANPPSPAPGPGAGGNTAYQTGGTGGKGVAGIEWWNT